MKFARAGGLAFHTPAKRPYAPRMNISRRLLLAGLAGIPATVPMVRVARGAAVHRLTILHMNDLHSRHEPVDARSLTCSPTGGRPDCLGGVARLATALARERAAVEAAGRSVLLLDAGDQFQGSLFYTAWKGDVELAVMHAIGTEAMALGNHEFDNGPANLARFVKAARFPVLSANTDASADPDLGGLVKPHVMVERGGLRIGIVGLTTQETTTGSSPGVVRFLPPRPVLTAAAATLRAQGAGLVVALSHLGVGIDQSLAGVVPGVDVFVGGHSHTLLSDSEAGAAGAAHQLVEGPAGKAVVVQAACYGRYFGRLDLDMAEDGSVLAYGGDVRHVGLELPEEPAVAAIVASYATQLDTVRKRVVGRTAAPIGNEGCRIGECALGNFIAGAMLATTKGADVALMNAGGIRTGLPGGEVTIADVLTVLPFGNAISVLKLTGADLQAMFANGVSRAGSGAFPQVAGVQLHWNPLTRALTGLSVGGAPVDPQRLYTVVTNNFLRSGGDGYTVLRDHAVDPYDGGTGLDDVVIAALTAASPLAPVVDGRIAVP
jgi:5'-nucleotidase/UDP-sugar diphosphatase